MNAITIKITNEVAPLPYWDETDEQNHNRQG